MVRLPAVDALRVVVACVVLVGLGGRPGPAEAARVPAASGLQALDWLQGRWQTAPGGAELTEEAWGAEVAGAMYALGRTVVTGADGAPHTVFGEVLRIHADPGRGCGVVYTAWPGGGPPTEFVCAERSQASVVFVNPDHDFPQRIAYRRTQDALAVEISGVDAQGAAQQASWTLHRVGP